MTQIYQGLVKNQPASLPPQTKQKAPSSPIVLISLSRFLLYTLDTSLSIEVN